MMAKPKKIFTFGYYVFLIPLSIFIAKELEIILRLFNIEFASNLNTNGYLFAADFIQWFGVLYSILVPLILLRVWQQMDAIDREFDREADAVKLLLEDIHYLQRKNVNVLANLIRLYVVHVINNYPNEINGSDSARIEGDQILKEIRKQYQLLMTPKRNIQREQESFVSEIYYEIRDVMQIRGDRIALASQRVFTSLRTVALVTSILFIVPFYFVGSAPSSSILDFFLIIGVSFLVIFIYMIIEDLGEPFGGTWKITGESWHRLLKEMDSTEYKQELEYKVKSVDKRARSTKQQTRDKRKSPTDILGS